MTILPAQRILITGATGFVGRALSQAAVERGFLVHGVARRPPRHPVPGVRYDLVDLVDEEATLSLIRRVRPAVVFHLASEVSGAREADNVIPMLRANLVAAVNVLLAAEVSSRPRVVLAGSMEEPGDSDAGDVPHSPYAAAKWAARGYGEMFGALYGLQVVHLRLFMIYGPGQHDPRKLVPYVCRSFLSGVAPKLMSGTRGIDWIFIDDVVRALLLAATLDGVDGRSFDVGSGRLVSVRSLVEQLAGVVGTDATPEFGALADRPLERVRVAHIDPAASALGWTPNVGLDEGLRRTVDFFRQLPTDPSAV